MLRKQECIVYGQFHLLSSASLLRAIRLKTRLGWGIYALTLTLAFYSYLYSVLIAIRHGIYIVIIERFRLSKTLNTYLVASLAGNIAFSPWVLIIINGASEIQSRVNWTNQKVSLLFL